MSGVPTVSHTDIASSKHYMYNNYKLQVSLVAPTVKEGDLTHTHTTPTGYGSLADATKQYITWQLGSA